MMYYGTELSALNFGIKRSQFKVTQWNNICWNHHCTGGGIKLMARVELDFLVFNKAVF